MYLGMIMSSVQGFCIGNNKVTGIVGPVLVSSELT